MRKAISEEFRADVVALARKGETTKWQIAKDFGISESCLHRWQRQAAIDEGTSEGLSRSERDELRETRKRVLLLEPENSILRRAAASFSRDVGTGSVADPSVEFAPAQVTPLGGTLSRVSTTLHKYPSAAQISENAPIVELD